MSVLLAFLLGCQGSSEVVHEAVDRDQDGIVDFSVDTTYEDGRAVLRVATDASGTSTSSWEHDAAGNVIAATWTSADGASARETWAWTTLGDTTTIAHDADDDGIIDDTTVRTMADGQVVTEAFDEDADGSIDGVVGHVWANGLEIERTRTCSEGGLVWRESWTYDARGVASHVWEDHRQDPVLVVTNADEAVAVTDGW